MKAKFNVRKELKGLFPMADDIGRNELGEWEVVIGRDVLVYRVVDFKFQLVDSFITA